MGSRLPGNDEKDGLRGCNRGPFLLLSVWRFGRIEVNRVAGCPSDQLAREAIDYYCIRNEEMKRTFTLEYWEDNGWLVGKLKEVPGVFSQGKTLEELKENVIDAYRMMLAESNEEEHAGAKSTELGVEVSSGAP